MTRIMTGAASLPMYDGTRLCNRGQPVVVVALNYRLGALGYGAPFDAATMLGVFGRAGGCAPGSSHPPSHHHTHSHPPTHITRTPTASYNRQCRFAMAAQIPVQTRGRHPCQPRPARHDRRPALCALVAHSARCASSAPCDDALHRPLHAAGAAAASRICLGRETRNGIGMMTR